MSRRTIFCVGALCLLACTRKGDDASPGGVDAGSFDKSALLRSFGECALTSYREVHAAAVELDGANRRAEIEATPAARDAAREAWKKAVDAWQRAEVFHFGPAAAASIPGGKDLRDPIYAWPLVSRCLIEQQLVAQTYDKPDLATALVSTRGLGAEEYLLFYEGTDNACPATASINAQGQWAALGPAEIQRRKASYARALGADGVGRVQALVDAWDPAKGNFLAEITNAGTTKVYASQQMAFNAVSDAMFYIDDELKDIKVGKPAGLVVDACAAPPCLDMVESPWAKRSKDHMRNNLIGFERLLKGCTAGGGGLGFDDLLLAVGAEQVAKNLDGALANVRAALDALTEPTFEDDLVKNAAGVNVYFQALRALSAVMKTELLSVLDLELPKKVEGDND